MSHRAAWIGGIVMVLVTLAVVLWPRDAEAPRAREGAVDARPPDWERWMVLDSEDARPTPARPPDPDLPNAPEDWEARRAEWRDRWRRAVDIAPLGPSTPGFDADDVREALAPGRETLRQCIRDNGGWRAMRDASRAAGEGRRPRRSVSFDVRPDGTVDAQSVAFEPPMPETFDACFATFFASARLEGVGADGARVELPMGHPRGRRDASGDGGVPWGGGARWRGGEGRGRGDGRGRGAPGRQDRAPE